MEIACLAILGILTGSISALFGIGGGMIIVPAMLYLHYLLPNLAFSVHDAIGISVMQMIFSSVFGTTLNIYKKKNLDIHAALFLGLGGLIGAAFSGVVLELVSEKHLTLVFLCVSLFTFYKFAFSIKNKPSHVTLTIWQQRYTLVIIGALTGIFAISLGIGGGVMLVPLLMHYLGFDTKKIVPLSLFFIMCAALSGTYSFIRHDVITTSVVYAGLLLGSFSLIGVIIGTKLIDIISTTTHHRILIAIYLLSIIATLNKVLGYYGLI